MISFALIYLYARLKFPRFVAQLITIFGDPIEFFNIACELNNLFIVKYLIKSHNWDDEILIMGCNSALKFQNVPILKYFRKHSISAEDHIQYDYFEQPVDLEFYEFINVDWFHLDEAIKDRNFKLIDFLISKYPNCTDDSLDVYDGGDGLYISYVQNPDIVEYIEAKNIQIDYEYLARYAAYYDELNMLLWLQKKNFDFNALYINQSGPIAIKDTIYELSMPRNSINVREWIMQFNISPHIIEKFNFT